MYITEAIKDPVIFWSLCLLAGFLVGVVLLCHFLQRRYEDDIYTVPSNWTPKPETDRGMTFYPTIQTDHVTSKERMTMEEEGEEAARRG